MSNYPRYEAYKPSGVEWIGDIPEGWKIRKLKFNAKVIFSNVDKHSNPNEEDVLLCNYTDVYNNECITSNLEFMKATASSAEIKKFQLLKNDVIATKDSESADDIAVPAFVAEDMDGVICGYHLAIIRANFKKVQGNYLYRLFSSRVFNTHFAIEAKGFTRFAVGVPVFNNALIPLPPLPEQRLIAAYLDHKTALIDRIISHRRRQIELLKEERRAVINHAVTRGIDPHVKLKPSGVEWLGDIPEGWEVRKLKYNLSERLKYGANEASEFSNYDQPRYIRITDFDSNGELRQDVFQSLPPELAEEFLLEEGDILFARSGATVGKTFLFSKYKKSACFAGYLIRAKVDRRIMISEFLYYFTKSGFYEEWKNSIFIQATIQNIGADKYSLLPIPTPSIHEQQEIVAFIDERTATIDTIISKYEKQINLLEEYRTALISRAVTGGIDVRQWRAPGDKSPQTPRDPREEPCPV